MKIVVQRVNFAEVRVKNKIIGKIEKGLLVLLGIASNDQEEKLDWMVDKILNLRIFNDKNDKMNLSVSEVNGGILVISQFTLLADARKGRRPSYAKAARLDMAEKLYDKFLEKLQEKSNLLIQHGQFGAYMKVLFENDGPVTIIIEK